MNHHEIVGEAEILDGEAVFVGEVAVVVVNCGHAAHAIHVGGGVVAVAEAQFAMTGHEAELEYSAGIGAGSAEGREIGDDDVAAGHHGFIAMEDLARGVAGFHVHVIVEWKESVCAIALAKRNLTPADLGGVGQEDIGACKVDIHEIPVVIAKRADLGTPIQTRTRQFVFGLRGASFPYRLSSPGLTG